MPVLLGVPGDLHHQTIHEDAALLKAKVTVIDSQAAFLRLPTPNPRIGKRELPAGFYLTNSTAKPISLPTQCFMRNSVCFRWWALQDSNL